MIEISYPLWNDLDKIEVVSGVLYSFEVHPKLHTSFSALLDAYVSSDDQLWNRYRDVQKDVKILLGLSESKEIEDAVMNDLLVEVEWIIEEDIKDSHEYIRAQLMTYANLLSSRIAFKVLNEKKACKWLDSRDIVITNDEWLDADMSIDIAKSKAKNIKVGMPIITSHGIGCTTDNENTLTKEKQYWEVLFNEAE
jgi:hypothetical protein